MATWDLSFDNAVLLKKRLVNYEYVIKRKLNVSLVIAIKTEINELIMNEWKTKTEKHHVGKENKIHVTFTRVYVRILRKTCILTTSFDNTYVLILIKQPESIRSF